MTLRILACAFLLCSAACGGASESTSASRESSQTAAASGGEAHASWEPARSYAPREVMYATSDSEELSAPAEASPDEGRTYAAAEPPAPAPAWGAPRDAPAQVASDGRPGPLLVYQAELHMAVYKIEQIQAQAIAVARELGGYLSEHIDRTRLVLRVPVAQYDTALARIESLGEVTHRFSRALDVTAQFRDLQMRLRNAEAMRERLLKLLQDAKDVPQSLAVENELNRVSERIEQMKGELKLMSDQIALSTITINFTVKRTETIDDQVDLPFPWLNNLGLQHLLSLE